MKTAKANNEHSLTESEENRPGVLSIRCQICSVSFKSQSLLTKHAAKHVAPGGFICPECKQRFVTETERSMHRELKHKISPPSPTENVTLKCDACDTEFKKPSKFRQHQETKCGTRKPYLCNLCGSSFISENTLRVHSTIHTEKKHFLCPICGSSFLSKGELKVHERTHTKETPFKCDKCPKSFSFRESLVTHSSVHTGIKPYICEACQSCFSCVGNLIKHRRVRPDTCGLPQYRGSTKCAPRASAKMVRRKQDAETTTDRKEEEEFDKADEEHILPDSAQPEMQRIVISEDDVVLEFEFSSGDTKKETLEVGGGQQAAGDEFDMSIIEELDDNAEQWPEAVEFVDSTDMDDLTKYVHLNVHNDDLGNNDDDELLMTTAPEFLDDEDDEDMELMEQSVFKFEDSQDDNDESVPDEQIADETDEREMSEEDAEEVVDNNEELQKSSLNEPELINEKKGPLPFRKSIPKPKVAFVEVDPESIPSLHLSAKIAKRSAKKKTTSRFPCSTCTRIFSSRTGLIDHEASKCGEQPLFRCEVCGKSYKSAGSLKTHSTMHTGKLPHKCSFCEKAFRTLGQKTVHERKHNGEKPFKCEFCTKSFAYRESLLTHISTHTGVKRFSCQGCGARFSCITNLKVHRKTHVSTCGKSPNVTKAMLCL